MYKVAGINAVPNQTVSFNVDGAFWKLHLFQSLNFVCADVTRNGNLIISGVRCFAGLPLMPYEYMMAPSFGNFIFDSDPDWSKFNDSCNLYYLDSSEYAEYKTLLEAA